jgi:hypothetical protein
MKTGITLITMSQGNPIVLKDTFDSFWGVVDEIIYGDLTLFSDDANLIKSYQNQFNLKIIKYPFNYIFNNGFSAILNDLINYSANDLCIYMNCSEVIEAGRDGILTTIGENNECNTFYFDHKTDGHRWFRLGRKSELKWAGIIHEALGPMDDYRPHHRPLFTMCDLPKDNENAFKSRCYDFCKEIVYFNNYRKLVDTPELLGNTDPGWLKFSKDNYQSFIDRMENKGSFYRAFLENDIELLYSYIYNSPDFEKERLESSIILEYQNDKRYLL